MIVERGVVVCNSVLDIKALAMALEDFLSKELDKENDDLCK